MGQSRTYLIVVSSIFFFFILLERITLEIKTMYLSLLLGLFESAIDKKKRLEKGKLLKDLRK